MPLVNLHTHSSYSDGTLSPAELLKQALKSRISYFSLTDHDTINGWNEIKEEIGRHKIRYDYGIELSTRNSDYLHILGYSIDPENAAFLSKLADYRERRVERIKRIFLKLNALGVKSGIEEMLLNDKTTFGRPHVAMLLKKKGYVRSIKEAFQKYISRGGPAYEPPMGPDVKEAIEDIKSCGGIAVLAHPGVVDKTVDFSELKDYGLDGLEVFYPAHTASRTAEYLRTAEKYSFLVTAGSDFHGPGTERDKMFGFEYKPEYFSWMNDRFKGEL
ncbi:MAG: hypothetical protein COT17_07020 [Elusimicrobia bacterium CG08_land_8_20_14_0_20_51_18]|nr:MAG: hypothetical protein COT17_07020 [Elusimicrobia bacterium CG08_land_8_20_14_0_20_51_18]